MSRKSLPSAELQHASHPQLWDLVVDRDCATSRISTLRAPWAHQRHPRRQTITSLSGVTPTLHPALLRPQGSPPHERIPGRKGTIPTTKYPPFPLTTAPPQMPSLTFAHAGFSSIACGILRSITAPRASLICLQFQAFGTFR